jgi:hypothetical protein
MLALVRAVLSFVPLVPHFVYTDCISEWRKQSTRAGALGGHAQMPGPKLGVKASS